MVEDPFHCWDSSIPGYFSQINDENPYIPLWSEPLLPER